jgi:Tol biopolymer transport system component
MPIKYVNRFFYFPIIAVLLIGCSTKYQQTSDQISSASTPGITETIVETIKASATSPPVPAMQSEATTNSLPQSIDQGWIAFYSDRDGNPEIYVMHPDGTQLRRLTFDPGFDDSPAISPDGQRVAFLTARHDPQPRFPDLKYEIYVVDINGENLRRLTNTEAAETHPAWSPDSKKISFDADYDGDGYKEIYTINMDGSELQRVTQNPANDQFADWSPDGKQIAFSSDRQGNWDLFVMDADGGNQRALTDTPQWEVFPAWSPDGNQIAFTGLIPSSRNTDVFIINADGKDLRQLTDRPGFDEDPCWSPDGTQIAYQVEIGGNFEIYLMDAYGSNQHPLSPHAGDDLWPSWK